MGKKGIKIYRPMSLFDVLCCILIYYNIDLCKEKKISNYGLNIGFWFQWKWFLGKIERIFRSKFTCFLVCDIEKLLCDLQWLVPVILKV